MGLSPSREERSVLVSTHSLEQSGQTDFRKVQNCK
jgi:hypothetical protein